MIRRVKYNVLGEFNEAGKPKTLLAQYSIDFNETSDDPTLISAFVANKMVIIMFLSFIFWIGFLDALRKPNERIERNYQYERKGKNKNIVPLDLLDLNNQIKSNFCYTFFRCLWITFSCITRIFFFVLIQLFWITVRFSLLFLKNLRLLPFTRNFLI